MRASIVLLLALTPSLAEACGKCGNYARCYYRPAYVKPYVAPAVTPVNIWNTNIINPSPIGQGNTVFRSAGYQQASIALFDRNAQMHGINEVARTLATGVVGIMARADASAQLYSVQDAPVVQALANAQAAETTLNALGMNITNAPGPQSSGFLLQRNSQGQWQTVPLDQQQIANVYGQATNGYANGQQNGYSGQQPPRFPMLTAFCVRCHSPDLQSPKGGVYLGDHPTVAQTMREKFYEITRAVSTGRMPPQGEQQPTQEQKAALFNEIESIISTHTNGNGAPRPAVQPQYQREPDQPPPPPVPDSGTGGGR